MASGRLLRKRLEGKMRMRNAFVLAIALAVGGLLGAQENGASPLKLLHTTPLPGFHGDLDHFAADLKGGRLFVTAEVHKTVEVFDLKTGDRIHSITGFVTPHAMVFRADKNKLFVADGGAPG